MKSYIATTGIVFALIFAAHVARVIAEGIHLIREPIFAFTSLLSLGFCTWACRLLFRSASL